MKTAIKKLQEKLGDPEGDFVSLFSIENGTMVKRYYIEFQYRERDNNGVFLKKEKTVPVAISYCPFTGNKLLNAE